MLFRLPLTHVNFIDTASNWDIIASQINPGNSHFTSSTFSTVTDKGYSYAGFSRCDTLFSNNDAKIASVTEGSVTGYCPL